MDLVIPLLGKALSNPSLGHYGRVILGYCGRRALGLPPCVPPPTQYHVKCNTRPASMKTVGLAMLRNLYPIST